MECEEPNCLRQATKVWRGRKVCADCYQKYSDEMDRMYQEMPT